MKTKIYIAGQMTGKECFNFEAFFVMAHRLKKAGFDVINPAQVDAEKMFNGWRYSVDQYPDVLHHDITLIKDEIVCIVLLDGWENSKGARAEKAYGEAIGVVMVSEVLMEEAIGDMPFESDAHAIQEYINSAIGGGEPNEQG